MNNLNKRGASLGGFIVALLLVALLIAFFSVILNNGATTYGGNADPAILTRYNYTAPLINLSTSAENISANDNFEVLGFFTKASVTSVRTIYDSTGIFALMLRDLSQQYPEVGFIIATIVAIVGIIIILIIVSAIFRYPLT